MELVSEIKKSIYKPYRKFVIWERRFFEKKSTRLICAGVLLAMFAAIREVFPLFTSFLQQQGLGRFEVLLSAIFSLPFTAGILYIMTKFIGNANVKAWVRNFYKFYVVFSLGIGVAFVLAKDAPY